MRYRHTQHARWMAALAAVACVAIVVAPLAGATAAIGGAGWYVVLMSVAIVLGWVSRLTVSIDDDAVVTTFGWGWPSRRVERRDIEGVRRVRVRWYHGWGIRKVGGGWMYNNSGWDAVELSLRSGGVFWIGTDEPDALVDALSVSVSNNA